MPRPKTPKLPTTPDERVALRAARISARDLLTLTGPALHRRTSGAISRARGDELTALAAFQTLGSVGRETARDLVRLGFHRISDLKRQDPRTLYERMCRLTRTRQDPCVEDAFRCAIAQARDPKLPAPLRNWWSWTPVRGRPMSARPPALAKRRTAH